MLRRVADHPALSHGLASRLELRLHERNGFSNALEDPEDRRQNLFQRDESDVDDRQRRLVPENARIETPGVRVLHHHHPVIATKLVVQLSRADIHGIHTSRASLQEAIREASSGGSDVDTDTSAHGHAEVVQRVRELLATATDVW